MVCFVVGGKSQLLLCWIIKKEYDFGYDDEVDFIIMKSVDGFYILY